MLKVFMKPRRWWWSAGAALGALALVAAACGGSAGNGQRLTVFAASSLTEAFQEMGRAFEAAHPGVKLTFSFAASSTLRAQLAEGARADLFASADQTQMELAQRAGAIEGSPTLFATNRLAVIVRKDAGNVQGLEDLGRPGLKLALAAPQVPIGAYTAAALQRVAAEPRFGEAFVRRVQANKVTEGLNVRQTVAAVELGQADAAVAYVTDARAGGSLRAIPLPEQFNILALYPVAVVRGASDASLARSFIAFITGDEGRTILGRFGFGVP